MISPHPAGGHRLTSQLRLEASRDEVFAFFADARNLELLTPPWLRFRVLTPGPIEMKAGALIDYKLRLRGLPMRWRSKISEWTPGERFVDEQVRGPYRWWRHAHTFADDNSGTLAGDDVHYAVPGGALIHRLLVQPDLERIFNYRQAKMLELFPGEVIA